MNSLKDKDNLFCDEELEAFLTGLKNSTSSGTDSRVNDFLNYDSSRIINKFLNDCEHNF